MFQEMSVPELKKLAKKVSEQVGEEPERWKGAGITEILVTFLAEHTEG